MIRFVAQRGVESLLVLLLMSFVVYGLIGLMPGDPIDIMLSGDPRMTPSPRHPTPRGREGEAFVRSR